jgi:hypothetical protein
MSDLYGNDSGHGQDIGKSNGKTIWRERIEEG